MPETEAKADHPEIPPDCPYFLSPEHIGEVLFTVPGTSISARVNSPGKLRGIIGAVARCAWADMDDIDNGERFSMIDRWEDWGAS